MDEGELLKRDSREVAVKDFKSVFYQMTAKPDSMSRVFNKDVVIDLSDIYELNERINEKLSQYQDAGYIISVNVKFNNRRVKSFASWDSFYNHKWYESEAVNNIVVLWEFNAMLPQYKVPQKHTLMVKMCNGMRPEELLNLLFTGNIEEIEEADRDFFPIVARVDFIDRILGDELLNIVQEWTKGLKESTVQKSKFVLFLKRHKAKFSSLLNLITNIFVMVCSILILGNYIMSVDFTEIADITKIQFVNIVMAIFLCLGVWILSKSFIHSLTDHLYDLLRDYGDSCLFNITKGDENKQRRIKSMRKISKIRIFADIAVTVLINIACGVFVNILFK